MLKTTVRCGVAALLLCLAAGPSLAQQPRSETTKEHLCKTPEMLVEAGQVYTLELGVETSAGYVSLEEDVLVTETGVKFLSGFQREVMMI